MFAPLDPQNPTLSELEHMAGRTPLKTQPQYPAWAEQPIEQPKPLPAVLPSKEALAALFWAKYRGRLTRKDEPLEADDIRDTMPFGEDGELHVQVHMRGFTDWYSLKFDAAGQPDPTTIEQLPF